MKNIFFYLVISSLLISCTIDDSDRDSFRNGTDFNGDISDLQYYYLETPVELKITNENSVNDTLRYQVGDTIKLSLSLNSIYEETITERYDLFQSTGATSYEFLIYSNRNIFNDNIIDLNFLENNPEVKGLNELDIETNVKYQKLYFNNNTIEATYNSENKHYECELGLVIENKTETHKTTYIEFENYIRNKSFDKEISIAVPIVSLLRNQTIVID